MSAHIKPLHETSLHVASLEESTEFYQRVFGLAILIEDERMVALSLPGGGALLLFQDGAPGETSEWPRGSQHLCLAIPTAAVLEWERHLMVNGIVIESRVIQDHKGISLYFRDPNGNSVEVATPGVWPAA